MVGELGRVSAADILDSSGLGPKLPALQTAEAQPHIAMSTMLGLEPLALASAMRSFYSTLFRRGDTIVPHAALIASQRLRREVSSLASRTLASTHRHIHQLVSREGSGYDAPSTILLHSPEEVETLLGLV
jgi:hypothetical protein